MNKQKYKKIKKLLKLVGYYHIRQYKSFLFGRSSQVMNIIPELKLICIFIPKTGITSLKSVFLEKLDLKFISETIHSRSIDSFQAISKKEIFNNKEYFKLSFVRNPFSRLVSCYKNKMDNENYVAFHTPLFEGKLYKGMSFEEFVKAICKIPDPISESHFRSQYSYLYHKGNLLVDFVGKFENMEKDFKVIQEKYNLNELPHYNKSSDETTYYDYYNKELVDLVYKRYKNDIIYFSYEKEYEDLKNAVKIVK